MHKRAPKKSHNRGQNLIEFAVLLGIVTVALMSMKAYFQRSVQSVVKVVADDYSNNTQAEPIGVVEMRVKQANGPLTLTSKSSSSMTEKKVGSKGSGISTETSGTTTVTGDSRTIVGDFRERDLQ